MSEDFGYYSSEVIELLKSCGASVFDRIRLTLKDGRIIEGLILPRPEYGDTSVLVLKLDNGYNIGVAVENVCKIELVKKWEKISRGRIVEKLPEEDPSKPLVKIIGTGGTIASRVDYTTGAVYPSFNLADLYENIPELFDIARLRAEEFLKIFSEDMTPELWSKIAEQVAKAFDEGASGVVIAHGTDTMGYTAAALSFALRSLPGPVSLVGAQRSSDRPSSDTALNLISAVTVAAHAPFAEVVVTMHGTPSDTVCFVHRGTKVRKMHTSRRDAFMSINDFPLAIVENGRNIVMLTNDYRRRDPNSEVLLQNKFDDKVALIKFYPGMDPEIVDFLVDKGYHGIVIEGTGLGHVRRELLKPIKRAIEEGIAVVITSQCLWGRVNLNVYRRGVELLKIGVIPAEDMLPETAYVKLSWVLAQTRDLKEVRRLMLTNFAHEINHRSLPEYYPEMRIPKLSTA